MILLCWCEQLVIPSMYRNRICLVLFMMMTGLDGWFSCMPWYAYILCLCCDDEWWTVVYVIWWSIWIMVYLYIYFHVDAWFGLSCMLGYQDCLKCEHVYVCTTGYLKCFMLDALNEDVCMYVHDLFCRFWTSGFVQVCTGPIWSMMAWHLFCLCWNYMVHGYGA